MPPSPASRPTPKRWYQERPSEYPWEQDGLDHIKRLMPAAEPFRAWATFSFTAASGRIHECDLLIATPGGLHLLELKAHPGRVINHDDTWRFTEPETGRVRTLRNPLHFTDVKSKDLKSRLEWAADRLKIDRRRLPRIEPAVFLSDPGLRAHLDELQSVRVYGRDDAAMGLPWIWRDLLAKPPQREHQRITPAFARDILPRLMTTIGVTASVAHLRFGDDWTLSPELLDAGPTWEDRYAERRDIVHETGRVRIYLTQQQASDDQRRAVERAARREYQVLQGITHRGIAQAVQIRDHHGSPAILFRHDPADLRLDSFLAVHGDRLGRETRLDLVRQLAEAVRYAHSRSLYHRALAARSVYVSAGEDGADPVLRVIDWQAAARDFEQTVSPTLGVTSLGSELVGDTADVYLAPEFGSPYPDPVDLDVFGLGAVAYLILTGRPPAPGRTALIDRLAADGGLHPYGVDDTITDALDALVFAATRSDFGERLDSAEAFLRGLDETEEQDADPEPVPGEDPLTATAGQTLDGDWEVRRVLGTGATARALLVERLTESGDGKLVYERRVLKVALDEQKAAALRAEARVLDVAGGGVVIRKLDGPRLVGERTVLDLQFGGGEDLDGGTLGALLRAEGRLTYHQLERFGNDLFQALDQLAACGVRHRDLKPDNFVVYERADRSKQLMLLDFSLAEASERDVGAGTRGYLDPFLGTARRPVYDDHAERYAAAVTLYEMAANARPVWGDGITDPRTTTDETPTIAAELFEPALRDELVAFFARALHRDVDRRFDSVAQMHAAWREVFLVSDAAAPATTPETVGLDPRSLEESREAAARAAQRDTPLEAAGLSPRAVSVAQSFGASTVGELLDVPLHQIARARGAGAVIRKEINRRHKQWAAQLAAPVPAVRDDAPFAVDELVALLLPTVGRRGSKKADVARVTLALPGEPAVAPWTTQSEVAQRLGLAQPSVSRHQQALFAEWATTPWLDQVRDEVVELLTAAARVSTAGELAAALRVRRGTAAESEHAASYAAAVVRAAVEAEIWAGLHSGDEETRDRGPRLAVQRRGDTVLIALESLPDTDAPSAAELADYAHQLGRRADELAETEPMPGRGAVVRDLRAVDPPDGLPVLADTRLVALAAAASRCALVSSRLEIYRRGLDLVTALRAAQAGAGVRRTIGVTVDDLLGRVRARFPAIVVPDGLTHVRMQEALRDAGFALEYDLAQGRFFPPEPEAPRRSVSVSSTTLGRSFVGGLDPHEAMRARLASAVARGGFLALTLRGRHLPGAADALARAYDIRPVDVGAVFLEEFRALVADRGQDWDKVLTVDARFTETGHLPRGLASYVRAAWEQVRGRLTDLSDDGVLFLHDAGLIGRYAGAGGQELLVGLQAAARSPAAAPHGLWLLCPGDSAAATPHLDKLMVEVTEVSERLVLDGDFLDGLRAGARGAA